jgi:hypothetical protein
MYVAVRGMNNRIYLNAVDVHFGLLFSPWHSLTGSTGDGPAIAFDEMGALSLCVVGCTLGVYFNFLAAWASVM